MGGGRMRKRRRGREGGGREEGEERRSVGMEWIRISAQMLFPSSAVGMHYFTFNKNLTTS